ncbi:MAG: hypothetical protein ACXV5F_09645, partial [Halobacteriota archaeon]
MSPASVQPYLLFARRSYKWFFATFLIVINQRVPITTNKPGGNRELAMPAVDQLHYPFIDLPES